MLAFERGLLVSQLQVMSTFPLETPFSMFIAWL